MVLVIIWQYNFKLCSFINFTFYRNLATHKVNEFLTESQTQTNAPILVVLVLYAKKLLKYIINF